MNAALRTCLAAALALASPYPAPARTNDFTATTLASLSIEELMEVEIPVSRTVSRHEESVLSAPASVSMVSGQDFDAFGYRTLADALRAERGVSVSYDRIYDYVGIRGFGLGSDYNTPVQLMVDGHRLNEGIFGSAPVGSEGFLDVDLIDQVEIIRGPSYSMYGGKALFGLVNVITRTGASIDGWETSATAGSYDSYGGAVRYGQRFDNGADLLSSISYSGSEGQDLYFPEFDSPETNHGVAERSDQERSYRVFDKLTVGELTLSCGASWRERLFPTGAWGARFNDNANEVHDGWGYLDASYVHERGDDCSWGLRLYYDRYLYGGTYVYEQPEETGRQGFLHNVDEGLAESVGGEANYAIRLAGGHYLIAGAEWEDQYRLRQRNYDRDPYVERLDSEEANLNFALFAQDEWMVCTNLELIGGARWDYYDDTGDTLNPRAGLIYHPLPGGAAKLLYGRSFRAPNAYEKYFDDNGATTRGNPELRPTLLHTYDAIWEQYFDRKLVLTVDAFYYDMDGRIQQVISPDDGLLVFQNLDGVQGRGVEAEISNEWRNGARARASYTYADVIDEATDDQLVFSARHLAKGNLLVPVAGGRLLAGPEVQYVSPRVGMNGYRVDDYVLVNITFLSRRLWRDTEISAGVYNVLDQHYADPATTEVDLREISQDGRSFRVKVSKRF